MNTATVNERYNKLCKRVEQYITDSVSIKDIQQSMLHYKALTDWCEEEGYTKAEMHNALDTAIVITNHKSVN